MSKNIKIVSKKVFYNKNHERDLNGHITKRDYQSYLTVECSLCHKPIKSLPSFSKHGKPNIIYVMGAGFKAPLVPWMDIGNIDYCEDCYIRLETCKIRLRNKFRKNYE